MTIQIVDAAQSKSLLMVELAEEIVEIGMCYRLESINALVYNPESKLLTIYVTEEK